MPASRSFTTAEHHLDRARPGFRPGSPGSLTPVARPLPCRPGNPATPGGEGQNDQFRQHDVGGEVSVLRGKLDMEGPGCHREGIKQVTETDPSPFVREWEVEV